MLPFIQNLLGTPPVVVPGIPLPPPPTSAIALGFSSFGLGAYGIGTPLTAQSPPDAPVGAKYLSYFTGDYERDGTGQYKRMPRSRHKVLLALATLRGSATASTDFGAIFPAKIDESFAQKVRNEVARALLPMTSTGEIKLDSVTVEQTLIGRVQITVAYTNADGSEDQVIR